MANLLYRRAAQLGEASWWRIRGFRRYDLENEDLHYVTFGSTWTSRTQQTISPKDDGGRRKPHASQFQAFKRRFSPSPPPPTPEQTLRSSGLGYLFEAYTGGLMTGLDVIEGCRNLAVRRGQDSIPAAVLFTDIQNGVAVIRAPLPGLTKATLSFESDLSVTDTVFALTPQAPPATEFELSIFTVTALTDNESLKGYMRLSGPLPSLQPDTPLFDLSGSIIATVVPPLPEHAPDQGIFAVRTWELKEALGGRVRRFSDGLSSEFASLAEATKSVAASTVMVECY